MDARPVPAAAGEADAGSSSAPAASWLRRRRTLLLWALVAVVVVGLAAAALWVGTRALAARDSLQRAQNLVAQLQVTAANDPSAAPALADRLVRETASAKQDTDGVLWRLGEAIPVAGGNLSVVRGLASAVDDVARNAVRPLAGAATSLTALKPVDGALDLGKIRELVGRLDRADAAVERAKRQVVALDASGTLGEVSAARDRLDTLLTDAAGVLGPAAKAAPIALSMLGGDGPRTYLLMFQNPAEANSLGGNPASMLLIGADAGRIAILGHASSNDFVRYAPPPVPLDPTLALAYEPRFPRLIQDIATRPDFPTMAQLAKGYWERQFGGSIDGVVSFDPVGLAGLLAVTGPVALPSGEALNADNAVEQLLYGVYARFRDPHDQDTYFNAAASAVFTKLVSGDTGLAKLLPPLQKAAEAGRLLLWSAHTSEQDQIAATPVAGILPADNAARTTVGVYFDDTSVSKLDYFVDTAVIAVAGSCSAAGPQDYTVTFTISSRIDAARAASLPSYVASGWLPRGQIGTDIYVLGPVGATFLDSSVVQPGLENQLLSTGEDLGRPVLRFSTRLDVAGSTTVSARFSAPPGKAGPLAVRTTPMVNPTSVAVQQAACG